MKPELKFGLSAGLILSALLIVSLLTKDEPANLENAFQNTGFNGFFWWFLRTLLVVAAMVFASFKVRESLNGVLKFGKAFSISYKTGWIVIITYTIVSSLYYFVIDPNWFPITWDQYSAYLEQIMDGSDVDFEQIVPVVQFVFEHISALMIFFYVLTNAIAFSLLALIAALISSKENTSEINL